MPTKVAPRVAVIGGGIAGLVAAWELSTLGIGVDLYERSGDLGGRIHSQEIQGQRFDLGAESFALRGSGVAQLISDLGLADRVQRPNPLRSWVIHPQISAPLPAAGMIGIPVAPLSPEVRRILGLRGSFRASCEPLLPKRIGRHANSVAETIRHRFGQRVLTRLVAPVVRGVYSTDPAALRMSAIPGLEQAWSQHGSLSAAARAQRQSTQAAGAAVASLTGGMGVLVEELHRQLAQRAVTLHLRSAVTRLRETEDGFLLDIESDEATSVVPTPAQAVIVTVADVPRVSVGSGVSARTAQHGSISERRPDTTVEVVALLLDNEELDAAPRGTGALVASEAQEGADPIRAKALTHSSAKWSWLADNLPPNRHLIRLSYGEHTSAGSSPADACTLSLTDAQTLRLACADATRILGVRVVEEQIVGMARQRHTIPPRDFAVARTRTVEGGTDGVYYAGEWASGTGLAAVIPAARVAARDCHLYILRATQRGTAAEECQTPVDDRGSSDASNSPDKGFTPKERDVLP